MRVFLFLGLLVLVSGCVTTHPAPLDTDAGRADLNARTAGRVATLYARGERHAARDLHVGPDETTWVNRLSGQPESARTSDVTSVSMHRGGSVWRLALIGAGVGAVTGLLAVATDDCSGGFAFCFTPIAYIGIFGTSGAAIGAGVGASQTERFVPPRRAGVRLDSLR